MAAWNIINDNKIPFDEFIKFKNVIPSLYKVHYHHLSMNKNTNTKNDKYCIDDITTITQQVQEQQQQQQQQQQEKQDEHKNPFIIKLLKQLKVSTTLSLYFSKKKIFDSKIKLQSTQSSFPELLFLLLSSSLSSSKIMLNNNSDSSAEIFNKDDNDKIQLAIEESKDKNSNLYCISNSDNNNNNNNNTNASSCNNNNQEKIQQSNNILSNRCCSKNNNKRKFYHSISSPNNSIGHQQNSSLLSTILSSIFLLLLLLFNSNIKNSYRRTFIKNFNLKKINLNNIINLFKQNYWDFLKIPYKSEILNAMTTIIINIQLKLVILIQIIVNFILINKINSNRSENNNYSNNNNNNNKNLVHEIIMKNFKKNHLNWTSSKFLLGFFYTFLCTTSPICVAARREVSTNCTFPQKWEGEWFLSGYQQSINIKGSQFSYRGKCTASEGNKYLIVDEKGCHRCLVIYEKHKNVLQFKESECDGDNLFMGQMNPATLLLRGSIIDSNSRVRGVHPNFKLSSDQYFDGSNDDTSSDTYCRGREQLQNLCDQIPGDALLYSLFRVEAEPIKCPLRGPYTFTYNRGHGECKSPVSNINSCTEESRILFSFQACPDVQGTESSVEELTCLANWKDGNSRYLVGLVSHHHAISYEERYRCFVYEKVSPLMGAFLGTGTSFSSSLLKDAEYKLAQSGDATCNGLDSAEVGSRIMTLRKPPPAERCDFPTWFKGPRHWHALMGNSGYQFHPSDGSLHITKPNGYMETKAFCEQINKQTPNEVMAVVHYTSGCQSGFMCMFFYRRDIYVAEIQMGTPAIRLEDACAFDHFDTSKLPYVTLLASNSESQICPLDGLYHLYGAIGPPYITSRHKRNHNNNNYLNLNDNNKNNIKGHNQHGHHHYNLTTIITKDFEHKNKRHGTFGTSNIKELNRQTKFILSSSSYKNARSDLTHSANISEKSEFFKNNGYSNNNNNNNNSNISKRKRIRRYFVNENSIVDDSNINSTNNENQIDKISMNNNDEATNSNNETTSTITTTITTTITKYNSNIRKCNNTRHSSSSSTTRTIKIPSSTRYYKNEKDLNNKFYMENITENKFTTTPAAAVNHTKKSLLMHEKNELFSLRKKNITELELYEKGNDKKISQQDMKRKRRDTPGCVSNYKIKRLLRVSCSEPNRIDVKPQCNEDEDEVYFCHGSWTENGTTFIVAKHSGTQHGVCISYRPQDGKSAKFIIGDACYRKHASKPPPDHHLIANITNFGKCGDPSSSNKIYNNWSPILIISIGKILIQLPISSAILFNNR